MFYLAPIEDLIKRYDTERLCNGELGERDWAQGISASGYPIVTEWVQRYYDDISTVADKLVFYREAPEETLKGRPHMRIKRSPVQILLKRKAFYSTHVMIFNPDFEDEISAGSTEVFHKMQFSVEIVLPGNHFCKVTYRSENGLATALQLIPGNPQKTKLNDPNPRVENSFMAYKRAHVYSSGRADSGLILQNTNTPGTDVVAGFLGIGEE